MRIYLAAPYSHESEDVRLIRFQKINKQSAELMMQGHIVFSPISHSHPIATQENLPLSADFWQSMNHSFIDWCDCVAVYQLDGWLESAGVKDEIRYATNNDKIVIYI